MNPFERKHRLIRDVYCNAKPIDGKRVVDEMCECGHRRSVHEDSLGGAALGHGACINCDCPQFTWTGLIYQ